MMTILNIEYVSPLFRMVDEKGETANTDHRHEELSQAPVFGILSVSSVVFHLMRNDDDDNEKDQGQDTANVQDPVVRRRHTNLV